MKIAGGKLKPSSFQQKKNKKIGPSGVKLRACKRRHSKTKFTASYGLSGSNGLVLHEILEKESGINLSYIRVNNVVKTSKIIFYLYYKNLFSYLYK